MDQVEQVAAREHAARVTAVTIQVGPLSGVEGQLLQDAWPIASAAGIARGAQLQVEKVAVRVRCLVCGSESEAAPNRLVCAKCGNFRTQLLSGEELLLQSVELERDGKVA